MITWIFPGQGSQSVGMASGMEADPATDVFDTARDVLGWDVRRACSDDALLSSTEFAQPAILTVSVAASALLEAHGLLPDLVAGHSVGEFAALVVARSLSFEDALRAVAARAAAMGAAGRNHAGAMAAIIGLDIERVEELCEKDSGIVVVANVNAPDQIVISGVREAVERVIEQARETKGTRGIRLAVSVAAHSPLMGEAEPAMQEALRSAHVLEPAIPYVCSSTGELITDPREIAAGLVTALTKPVRWTDCVHTLATAGTERFVEVGPGRVLSGLVRRILPEAQAESVGNESSAASCAHSLLSGARA